MAIIHLADRNTRDKNEFSRNLKSVSSYVYVSQGTQVDPFEISLTIGESYSDSFPSTDDGFKSMPEVGLYLRPGGYYIFETREKVQLPNNIFGVIFPKGSLIIRYAVSIPTTKIDPGFDDSLYIFMHNLGDKPFHVKTGDIIASVSFFSTDSTPSFVPETRKPSHRGRVLKFGDRVRILWGRIRPRVWDIVTALIGGGIVVFVLEKIIKG